jgi:hypothetical protein
MLQKIKTIEILNFPARVCTTSDALAGELEQFQGKKICLFMGKNNGKSYFAFAAEDGNGGMDLKSVAVFAPPCPPFCTHGELYAEV